MDDHDIERLDEVEEFASTVAEALGLVVVSIGRQHSVAAPGLRSRASMMNLLRGLQLFGPASRASLGTVNFGNCKFVRKVDPNDFK
jgi:hypothetical protein